MKVEQLVKSLRESYADNLGLYRKAADLLEAQAAVIAAAKATTRRDQQWMDGINEACRTQIRFDPLDWETRHLKPLDTFVQGLRDRATSAEQRAVAAEERVARLEAALHELMPRYIELYEAAGLGDPAESVGVEIARTALAQTTESEENPNVGTN